MRQDPAPGQRVPVGSEVRLYIAGPPEAAVVPDVVDQELEEARSLLDEAGLQAAEEGPVWSPLPANTVIAQEPEAGTELQAGDIVTITISGGTEQHIEIQANLGGFILLERAELLRASFRPGDTLSISLRWQALATIPDHYVVFVHLISPGGNLVAQQDTEPSPPTNTWTIDTALWNSYEFTIPAGTRPGTYQVRAGMYPLGQPGNRLQVFDPGETTAESNSVLLAEIEITP